MKHTKKVLLIVFLVLLIGAAFLLLETKAGNSYLLSQPKNATSQTPSPKTLLQYSDGVDGFSLSYPSDWTYRSYEGGVGFRPVNEPNEPQYEYITVSVLPKPTNVASLPFDQYVKVAAISEIQNYQSLASLKPFTTQGGLTGYSTTWMVLPLGGGSATESLPIVYFPTPDQKMTTQMFLNNKEYMDVFMEMIPTFQEIKKNP